MQKTPQKQDLLKKIRDGYSLPALSVIAVKLIKTAFDDNFSINDAAELIEKDPSITVRLLKCANSAFFRNGDQVTTIQRAVQKIGFNHLKILVLSFSLRDTYPMGKVGPMDYEEFWKTSLYRAVLARALAEKNHNCDPDEAFVAGLTLEIGFLIFFDLFINKNYVTDTPFSPLTSPLAWEKENFGLNHREIGEEALRYWQIPETIVECQRFYGLCGISTEGISTPQLALTCDTARKLANIISDRNDRTANWHIPFTEAQSVYGINGSILVQILITAFDEVKDIADSLKLDINKEEDIMALTDKATETLRRLKASSREIKGPLGIIIELAKRLKKRLEPL